MDDLPPPRFARTTQFLKARLTPGGYLGLHLTIGLAILLLTGWCFADIAEDVTHHEAITRTDESVALWFHHHGTITLTVLARAASFIGSVAFLSTASALLGIGLAWKRYWNQLLVLALTMIGGSGLNIVLKHYFHRQRPILENPLVTLTSYGFPSGHTMGSTIFYGLLALLAAQLIARRGLRVFAICIAVTIVILVGTSRIYLGAHYLSDVLGAIAAGLAWLVFCWTGCETLRRRHLAENL